MKKLFLLSFFIITALAFSAQRFEVSEQADVSFTNNAFQKNGFANQFAIGYQPVVHVEISAFYELNKWASVNNSFGLALDYTARYFFLGLEAKYATIKPYNENSWVQDIRYTYHPALGYGLHAGSKQKLTKRLSLVEQIGYVWVPFTLASEGLSGPAILYGIFPGGTSTSVEGQLPKAGVDYLYARVGLSYRL